MSQAEETFILYIKRSGSMYVPMRLLPHRSEHVREFCSPLPHITTTGLFFRKEGRPVEEARGAVRGGMRD